MSTRVDAHLAPVTANAELPLSITLPFLRLAGFFACLDLVSAMAASGFFKGMLGDWYVIVTPSVFVMVVALLHYSFVPTPLPRKLTVVSLIFASLGLYEYVMTGAVGGLATSARWQLVFGFAYPAVLMLFLCGLSEDKQLLFWRWFFIGFVVYIAVGFVLVVKDGIFWSYASTGGIGAAILYFRYNFENSLFALVMGNANKTSNYMVLALMLGPILLGLRSSWGVEGRGGVTKPSFEERLYKTYAVLSIIMMIVMFSRIILLLLPIPIYLNRRYLFGSRKSARVSVGIFVGFLALLYVRYYEQINFVVQYLLFSSFLGGEAQGILGTGKGRFGQWAELASILNTLPRKLVGIGYGTYGILNDCENCGTHNLFLDHWVASGVYGLLVLLGLMAYGSLKALLARYWLMLATFAVFFALAMREYSMAYLNVTSMGGLMFLTLFYCLLVRPQLKE